tara:strand:+ start:209 stop:898 length:690 start_codon:yes stop_codon:yes gene_type:complete
MKKIYLSFIIPVYNSEKILEKLIVNIIDSAKKIKKNYEIVLVDDCSADNSYLKLKKLKNKYSRNIIRIFKNKRNIGQHKTIFKLIKKSRGEKILVLDCDFFNEVKYLKRLFNPKYKKFNVIYATFIKREKSFTSFIFWNFLKLFLDKRFDPYLSNYILLDKKSIKLINKVPYSRFLLLIAEIFLQDVKTKKISLPTKKNKFKSTYNLIKCIILGLGIIYEYLLLRKISK